MVRNFEPLIIHLSKHWRDWQITSWGKFWLCPCALPHSPALQDPFLGRGPSSPQARWLLEPQRTHTFRSCQPVWTQTPQLSLTLYRFMESLHRARIYTGNRAIWVNKWWSRSHVRELKFTGRHIDYIFFDNNGSKPFFWVTNPSENLINIHRHCSLKNPDMYKLNWILHSFFWHVILPRGRGWVGIDSRSINSALAVWISIHSGANHLALSHLFLSSCGIFNF